MLFGIARHADAQVRVVFADQADQFVRVAESACDGLKSFLALRRIAPEGHDVANPARGGFFQPGQ